MKESSASGPQNQIKITITYPKYPNKHILQLPQFFYLQDLIMFPSHQGNELFIQFSSDPINQQQQQHKISEDLILLDHHHHQASFGVINDDSTENLGIKPRRRGFNKSYSTNSANDSKKMLHRDIERQRRQEMSTLYKSLRSLLPFELIKGKRSMSDHMNEAVNYIKLLQNNIEEKGATRDELKNLSSTLNTVDHYGSGSGSGSSNSCLTVYQSSSGGVEIEITSSSRQLKLPLSRILEVLIEEGLEVVNCVSTKVNGRFLHSIQSELVCRSQLHDTILCNQLSENYMEANSHISRTWYFG